MELALCIRDYKDIKSQELVSVYYSFNGIEITYDYNPYMISQEDYDVYFRKVEATLTIPKTKVNLLLFKVKRPGYCFSLKKQSPRIVAYFNRSISYYVHQLKLIDPDLLIEFNYSIISTLESLKVILDAPVPEIEKLEAIKITETLFFNMYASVHTMTEGFNDTPEHKASDFLYAYEKDLSLKANFFKDLQKHVIDSKEP